LEPEYCWIKKPSPLFAQFLFIFTASSFLSERINAFLVTFDPQCTEGHNVQLPWDS
jgi:hypothetical protein